MQKSAYKTMLALSASSLLLAALPVQAQAQVDDTSVNTTEDVVITTGTRRALRSAADTPAPVDVITGIEFTTNAADDVQDLLNGKRRHRGAVIAFLGGGIADGSQGVDVSSIPSLALNFVLKDAPTGGVIEAKYGSTYDGDGDNYRLGANLGLPLGDQGFFNITAEYGETDGTVRSVVRDDVQALIAAGNTAAADFLTINTYTDEVPQYWGQPDVEGDLKLLFNTALEFNENIEAYAVGTYAERQTTGGFFYRNFRICKLFLIC